MLTRLSVDGFKNLLGVTVDLGPYTCIAGPNASGKSNLFDVITFLSLLADHPIMEAAELLRATRGLSGDPRSLFWTDGVHTRDEMHITAEMIVPLDVSDDFGRSARASITYLRYDLALRYEAPSGLASSGRIVLKSEKLSYIRKGDAAQRLAWPHSKIRFRDRVILGKRFGSDFVSTIEADDGQTEVRVHQDGGSRGQPRPALAAAAPRTVVSTTTTSSDPTILAARREFQSWRLLALEPSAMRSPDPFSAPPTIAPNGAHLARTLYHLASEDPDNSDAIYAQVASRASALTDVRSVRVARDDRRELLVLEAKIGNGSFLPARALSDGTLRFLALCILSYDKGSHRLLCMEEPENGIHPGRLDAMVELVRDLATEPEEGPEDASQLRQVIVNTHSPGFVSLQDPNDLLVAIPTRLRIEAGGHAETVRFIPLQSTWRAAATQRATSLSALMDYLAAPPGAQLALPTS